MFLAVLAISCGQQEQQRTESRQVLGHTTQAASVAPEWPAEVLVGLRGVRLDKNADITGDIAVLDVGDDPELDVDKDGRLQGSVRASRIELDKDTLVTGSASFNTLSGSGTVQGTTTTPLPLPLVVTLPLVGTITPGASDLSVASGSTHTLLAGAHNRVRLANDATLRLTGGSYQFRSLEADKDARIECVAACDIRVLEHIDLDKNAFLGPADGATIGSENVDVRVAGGNDCTSVAVDIDKDAKLRARIAAPHGTLQIDKNLDARGILIGCRVVLKKDAKVIKDATELCTNVDDGNPCTADSCDPATGVVTHTPVAAGTACPDADACNGAETCDAAGVCQAAAPPVIDDGNVCTVDACDPATGVSHTPLPAGAACADADVCNGAETCSASGVCEPGAPLEVDDGNPCTTDSCDPIAGAVHTPLAAGTACPDANVCNGSEVCSGSGVCQAGTPPSVDDGNPCTADACDPALGVTHTPVPSGTACADSNLCNGNETCDVAGTCQPGTPPTVDDGNPCTADACDPVAGVTHTPVPSGTACPDANACNGEETCNATGACQAGTPPSIDDGNPCTSDACDPVAGVTHIPVAAGSACADADLCNGDEVCDAVGVCQAGTPPALDDGNPCTSDACDPIAGVSHPPVPAGAACADADVCNGDELCDAAGACQSGVPLNVDDANPCTADACDPATGVSHSPVAAGTSCADGDACNGEETCNATGVCQAGSPLVIDDGNPCTADACDPSLGVSHTPVAPGTSCADGDVCDGAETCDAAGTCQAGTPLTCDDGNVCTTDACNPASGCDFVPASSGSSCADGDLCNGEETCDGAGVCGAGTPLVVDDGNPCTADACDPVLGATHTPVAAGTSCTDLNACNGAETCDAAGICQGGTAPTVDDGNPCTSDVCDPVTGVVHTPLPNGTSCADPDACNGEETCDPQGVCQAGTPPVVDDGNVCTEDACEPATGVTHVPVTAGTACGDSNVCNGDELCDAAGTCAPGAPLSVDDGNACTVDACDPVSGVSHLPIPNCDGAPTHSTGRFETRASLLGRVVRADGSPISGYTLSVFDAPITGPARTDVVSTLATDGSFRLRLTGFPETVPDRTPPTRVLVKLEGTDFVPLLREAYLRPGDAVNLGNLVVLERDPAVTMIGPAGGTATDSQGVLELSVPPGALASTVPIRLTRVPDRDRFPYPLPDTTVTGFGMVLEPEGTQFALPATLRVANYQNAPVGLSIPVGFVDEVAGRWKHEGFALWDGERFRTQIHHFSTVDLNHPTLGQLVVAVKDGVDPRKSNSERCPASSIALGSGGLRQDVPLVSYERAGNTYGVGLSYDSSLGASLSTGETADAAQQAATPTGMRVPVAAKTVSFDCVAPGGPPSGGAAGCAVGSCVVGGLSLTDYEAKFSLLGSTTGVSGSAEPGGDAIGNGFYVDVPLNADGSLSEPSYQKYEYTMTINNPLESIGSGTSACVGGGAAFGVADGALSGVATTMQPGTQARVQGYELVYHRRASAFGAGWGLDGVSEAFRTPDGYQVDVINGRGIRETFLPRAEAREMPGAAILPQPKVAMTHEPATGRVFMAAQPGSVYELLPDGTLSTLLSGLAFSTPPVDLAVTTQPGGLRFIVALHGQVVEVDSSGLVTVLYTRPAQQVSLYNQPHVAAFGANVYFTVPDDDALRKVRLDDATRTVTTLTMAEGGDINLDSDKMAAEITLGDPRGLAVDVGGSLYVASASTNAVYRFSADATGEVDATSSMTRVLGNGQRSMILSSGSSFPALSLPIDGPLQLSTAPDGRLLVISAVGAFSYDPVAETVRLVVLDKSAHLSDVNFDVTQNGSFVALSATSLLINENSRLLVVTVRDLVSEYEPTRSVALDTTGMTLVDTTAGTVERYVFRDAGKHRLNLASRSRRTGEVIATFGWSPGGGQRLEWIEDQTGTRTTLAYSSSGKIQGITDPAGRQTLITVDANGDLTSVRTPSGETRTYAYDSHRMTTAADPRGEASTYTYASTGSVATATRAGGGMFSFTPAFQSPSYDSDGKLTYAATLTDDRGVTHSMVINSAGFLERDVFDADGITYDLRDSFATTLIGPTFALDRKNRIYRVSERLLNGVPLDKRADYDALGRMLRQWSAPSGNPLPVYEYAYDQNDFLASVNPFRTNIRWDIQRDTSGRPTRVFDALSDGSNTPTGRETLFTWRADGQPDTVTQHGVLSSLTYDPATGNLTNSVDAVGRTLALARDAAGNVTSLNDGSTTVQMAYDSDNRVTSITDALSNTTTIEYANAGCACSYGDRPTALKTPDLAPGQQWTFQYDPDGRPASVTDPVGNAEQYTYSPAGDLESFRDRNARLSTFIHDQLGRPLTMTDPAGRVGVYSHPTPVAGQWQGASVFAASPNATAASTDLTVALADGQYQIGLAAHRTRGQAPGIELYRDATFRIDFGNDIDFYGRTTRRQDRTALTFATGLPTGGTAPFFDERFSYDNNTPFEVITGISGESTSGGESGTLPRDYEFDVTQTTGWNDAFGGGRISQETYTRDTAGRVTRIDTAFLPPVGELFTPIPTEIGYDPAGRVVTLNVGTRRETRTYDSRGLVSTRTLAVVVPYIGPGGTPQLWSVGTFVYQYDSLGRNTTLEFPDGHRRVQQWDELGRLTSRCYEYPAVAPTRCYTAQYDPIGNPTLLDDPETTSTITYDLLDRITEVRTTIKATSAVEVETYAYNSLGAFSVYDSVPVDHQRPRLDGNGAASAGVPATHEGQPVDMDGAGRITRLGDSLLSYNRRGRLARVVQPGLTEAYAYDVLQRRVATSWTISSSSATLFHQYEPDVADADVQSGARTNSVPTSNIAASYHDDAAFPAAQHPFQVVAYDGVDHPLWMYTAGGFFFELDTLGNARRLRGHLRFTGDGPIPLPSDLGGYRYGAFGKLKPPDAQTPLPSATFHQPLRWQGRWWNETEGNLVAGGTYDFRARTWSPELGAFLQADELGFLTSTGTLWSWPGQNAGRSKDPTGRFDPAGFLTGGATAAELIATSSSLSFPAASALVVAGIAQVVGTAVLANQVHQALDPGAPDVGAIVDAIRRGPGERRRTARPDGTPNPFKRMRPHPTDPRKVIFKDPDTGRDVVKPKPPGFPEKKKNCK
jgi:YD repeat-containing protein